MKWVLVVLINLMYFSAFAQECSWHGMEKKRKEEFVDTLIKKTKEKVDEYLAKGGIIKVWEDSILVEEVKNTEYPPPNPQTDVFLQLRYRFKTQRSDISSIPNDHNRHPERWNYGVGALSFFLFEKRDSEGYIIKSTCSVSSPWSLNLPLFNLTLDDYFLGKINISRTEEKIFEFEISPPLSFD